MYRLDAVDAFRQKLVKRIEVAAATAKAQHNRPYVKLVGVKTKKGSGPKATVELDVASANGSVTRKEITLTGNEDLEQETRRDIYRNVRVGEIRGGKGAEAIELRLPGETKWLNKGETHGGIDSEAFEAMLIERAVTSHLDKELLRRQIGIKVLTLFFVDQVADYREYDAEGHARPGRLARVFEDIYKRKLADAVSDRLKRLQVAAMGVLTPIFEHDHACHHGIEDREGNGASADAHFHRDNRNAGEKPIVERLKRSPPFQLELDSLPDALRHLCRRAFFSWHRARLASRERLAGRVFVVHFRASEIV